VLPALARFLLRRVDRGELKPRFCRRYWGAVAAPRSTLTAQFVSGC